MAGRMRMAGFGWTGMLGGDASEAQVFAAALTVRVGQRAPRRLAALREGGRVQWRWVLQSSKASKNTVLTQLNTHETEFVSS